MHRALLLGLAATAVFVLAHPPMWGGEPPLETFGWDLTRVFWADVAFARHAVLDGELPVWNPYDRAGYPFLAEPQSGMYDPITWLVVAFSIALGSAPPWLIVLKQLLFYGVAASGMAAFLRERRIPWWATSLGTLAFVLCPRIDKLKDQSALWPTAWIGWLLLATDRCIAAPTLTRGAWLGVAAAMTFVSGYPPGAFRLGIVVLPYGLVGLVRALRTAPDRRAYARRFAGAIAVASTVVATLCVGQIVATAQVLPATKRAAIGLDELLSSSVQLEHAAGILSAHSANPQLLLYFGFALVIGIGGAFLRPRADELVLLAVAGFGFVLACGGNTPVLPALASLPGFSAFRIPGHYLVLTTVGAVLVGTLGLARLAEQAADAPRWPAALTVGYAVAAFALLADDRDAIAIAIVAVTSALAIGLFAAPSRWRGPIGWALVGVLGLDLFAAGHKAPDLLQPLPRDARTATMIEAMADPTVHRIADYEWGAPRVGPRHRVRDLIGHRPALTDPRYMTYYRVASRSSNLLRAASVSVVGYRDEPRTIPSGLVPVEGQSRLYRVPDPWPLAYFTDRIALVDDTDDALRLLRRGTGPIAVFERETLDAEAQARLSALRPTPAAGEVRIDRLDLHRVELSVEAPSPGVVVLSEAYDRGWRATVDGEHVPIERVNLIFRAIELPAGSHRVVFTYQPPGVRLLWWLWFVGMLGVVGLAIVELRRLRATRRTPPRPEPPPRDPH